MGLFRDCRGGRGGVEVAREGRASASGARTANPLTNCPTAETRTQVSAECSCEVAAERERQRAPQLRLVRRGNMGLDSSGSLRASESESTGGSVEALRWCLFAQWVLG